MDGRSVVGVRVTVPRQSRANGVMRSAKAELDVAERSMDGCSVAGRQVKGPYVAWEREWVRESDRVDAVVDVEHVECVLTPLSV